jgi:3-isopropylmalate/(R)-2-methylmalate dehydratase small subunit
MSGIKGKAFVFGNNIDTDQIYPGRYLELVAPSDIAEHCLEGADPTFVQRSGKGDIVVGGTNFGCGSSREHAAITLLHAGVGVVLAESFARIFYRNALNLALPLMVCPGIGEHVSDGDELEVDMEEGTVRNLTTGETLTGQRVTGYALEILKSGGIKPLMRKKMQAARQ